MQQQNKKSPNFGNLFFGVLAQRAMSLTDIERWGRTHRDAHAPPSKQSSVRRGFHIVHDQIKPQPWANEQTRQSATRYIKLTFCPGVSTRPRWKRMTAPIRRIKRGTLGEASLQLNYRGMKTQIFQPVAVEFSHDKSNSPGILLRAVLSQRYR